MLSKRGLSRWFTPHHPLHPDLSLVHTSAFEVKVFRKKDGKNA